MPDFEKHFKKQRPFWDAFMQYKLSETSEKRTTQAKENASKKKHFHHLGQGGYSTVIPKWQKMEDNLTARESYRRLSTGHSEQSISSMLMEREAVNKLDEALKAVSEGSFKLDREKDELTYALGTPERTDVYEVWV